ncbi:MAG: ABC transporter substrate-binding protein [Hyphomonas sp.]
MLTPGCLNRRQLLTLLPAGLIAACSPGRRPSQPVPETWTEILAAARGQTVRWNAWAGDPNVNAYIAWCADELASHYGLRLEHLKTDDTSSGVTRLLADKTAGRIDNGSMDLLWINGENFAAARQQGLLYGPFARRLPHADLVDWEGKPSTARDFTLPTDGFESPWGMAQITFFHDSARGPAPPRSVLALLDWARARRGRFAYPAPGDFAGVTFLKQALSELIADPAQLQVPVVEAQFQTATAPLWAYLERLHPHLWRAGQAFPSDTPTMMRLFEDRETELAFAFNPAEAAVAVSAGRLPASVRAYTFDKGTIANAHFVAIPFNSAAKEGAMVTADFLLSPKAQARKADPALWGDAGVLALDRLSAEERALFDRLGTHLSLPGKDDQRRTLPEPHPSWHVALSEAWRARFAK